MQKKIKLIMTLLIMSISTSLCAQSMINCSDCSGSGYVANKCTNCKNGYNNCTACNNSGRISSTCTDCSGRGYTTQTKDKVCSACGGSRYTKMSKQVKCPNCRDGQRPTTTRGGNTTYVACSRCNGSSYITEFYNAACRPCGGRGVNGTTTVNTNCSSCSSSGRIPSTCSRCNGAGSLICGTCQGYGSIKNSCRRCGGRGKVYARD